MVRTFACLRLGMSDADWLFALVLELVDRHDSGSCVRKGVGVRFSPRAFLRRGEIMRLVIACMLVVFVAGCDRHSRPVAGKSAPTTGPNYTVKTELNLPPAGK